MNPDLLKVVVGVFAVVAASPVAIAGYRAIFFFGRMENTVTRLEATMTSFTQTTERALQDHDRRITTIEAERDTEERLRAGRRETDPVVRVPRGGVRASDPL